MFYTYAHYKKDTGEIFYIGKGHGKRHSYKYNRKNPYWQRVVDKYNFTSEILAYWDTEQEAFDHEKLLIACFKDMGIKLTNMTDGGEGSSGRLHTEEYKKRMSVARMGKVPRVGFKISEEHKKKISKARKGMKFSEETKKKMSLAKIGKAVRSGFKVSEETRKKMSEAAKRRKQKESDR